MANSIPRFLTPRGHESLRLQALTLSHAPPIARFTPPTTRHASTNIPKPIRLEKPAKFVPPSHGKRLKQQIPRHYGPDLTHAQKTEQATKKYPHMMPAPGTFMFWFLTNRSIHAFITLGTLFLLASFTAYENWKQSTAFRDQLPTGGGFISHPIASTSQVIEIYKLHVMRTSAETAEKRKKGVEDVQKRSTYRRAHGLESEDSQGLGGWTALGGKETVGPSLHVDGPVGANPLNGGTANPVAKDTSDSREDGNESTYVDWDGKKKPLKKWLGIW